MHKQALILAWGCLLVALAVAGSYWLFFDSHGASTRYSDPKDLLKSRTGGEVINRTNHTLRVTQWRSIKTLQPGQSSKDIGVQDADAIMFDHPTKMQHQVYSKGLFKMCDLEKFEVVSKQGIDVILTSSRGALCRTMGGYHYFDKLEEAFPYPLEH